MVHLILNGFRRHGNAAGLLCLLTGFWIFETGKLPPAAPGLILSSCLYGISHVLCGVSPWVSSHMPKMHRSKILYPVFLEIGSRSAMSLTRINGLIKMNERKLQAASQSSAAIHYKVWLKVDTVINQPRKKCSPERDTYLTDLSSPHSFQTALYDVTLPLSQSQHHPPVQWNLEHWILWARMLCDLRSTVTNSQHWFIWAKRLGIIFCVAFETHPDVADGS